MSEAIELEQWWADIADELGVQAAYLHVHGMDWRGRTDGNEVVARAVATIAGLREELAEARASNTWLLDRCSERADERDAAIRQRDETDLYAGRCLQARNDKHEEVKALTAQLSELRERVEAAVARCQRTISAWNTNHDAVSNFRCEEASDLLAILSPPEGP